MKQIDLNIYETSVLTTFETLKFVEDCAFLINKNIYECVCGFCNIIDHKDTETLSFDIKLKVFLKNISYINNRPYFLEINFNIIANNDSFFEHNRIFSKYFKNFGMLDNKMIIKSINIVNNYDFLFAWDLLDPNDIKRPAIDVINDLIIDGYKIDPDLFVQVKVALLTFVSSLIKQKLVNLSSCLRSL